MAKGPYEPAKIPVPDPKNEKPFDYREKIEAQLVNLHRRLNQSEENVLELQTKLKETIRAVEKLAKGKSIGALGLPTEESWASPA
jgi:hypothetical protein